MKRLEIIMASFDMLAKQIGYAGALFSDARVYNDGKFHRNGDVLAAYDLTRGAHFVLVQTSAFQVMREETDGCSNSIRWWGVDMEIYGICSASVFSQERMFKDAEALFDAMKHERVSWSSVSVEFNKSMALFQLLQKEIDLSVMGSANVVFLSGRLVFQQIDDCFELPCC